VNKDPEIYDFILLGIGKIEIEIQVNEAYSSTGIGW